MADTAEDHDPINLQDPVEKTVGKRRVRDVFAYGMKLQKAAGTFQQTTHWTPGTKGVHRFRSFEEADQWLIRLQARPKR